MVSVQVALALVLLAAAGHAAANLWRGMHTDPGFQPEGVLTATVRLPDLAYPGPKERLAFAAQAADRLRGIPGADSAGLIHPLPFGRGAEVTLFSIESAPVAQGEPEPEANYVRADDGVAAALGLRLRSGRWFERTDVEGSEPVAVIDQKLAARFWPGVDPLGTRVSTDDFDGPSPMKWRRVIGVVEPIVQRDLLGTDPRGILYVPIAQDAASSLGLVIRAAASPMALAGALRREVGAIDQALPLSDVRTMSDLVADSLSNQTTQAWVLGVFAAAAVLLAGLGIYGVMTQAVQAREHEIGVRRVLGAGTGDVARLILLRGLRVVALGALAGIAAAAALGRILPAFVPDTIGVGIPGYAALLALVFASALLPLLLALRRALRVTPLRALRGV
jgi:predicted permease